MTNRAYSTLEIKSSATDGGKRRFVGIASTPSTDRMGDVIDPKGMVIKIPTPLLWQHNSRDPIGWVKATKVSKDGIEVECEVANVTEPGKLKDRLDEYWQMLIAGLVRGLSVGFRPIESARIEESYGMHFLKTELLELSCVTVPANQDCSLTSIKSADQAILRAALGTTAKDGRVVRLSPAELKTASGSAPNLPGASGTSHKPAHRRVSLFPKGN